MKRSADKSTVKSSQLSGGLDREHLGQMYAELGGDLKTAKMRRLEAQLAEAKRQAGRYGKLLKPNKRAQRNSDYDRVTESEREVVGQGMGGVNLRSMLLMGGIVCLASLKVIFSTGIVDASSSLPENSSIGQARAVSVDSTVVTQEGKLAQIGAEVPTQLMTAQRSDRVSETEKQVLLSLDARRVALEQRRTMLEQKENELKQQQQALAERVAELKSLTVQLAEQRKERDAKFEARLEQLAAVYGSMAPNEAAPLVGKLDEEIALALLERMPGKRMGQILSVMEQDRAVELTRKLTNRGKK